MASTNQTSNLELSQFIGSDSPKWLTDYNSDMEKIDTGYGAVKAQADATDLVVSGHTSTISSLSGTVGDQTNAIQNLRAGVTANTGSINTINSLIGNGEPTTTDKTLIGAINELNEKSQDIPYVTMPTGTVTEVVDQGNVGSEYTTAAYTAAADGWVKIAGTGSSADGFAWLQNTTRKLEVSSMSGGVARGSLPVKAGDSVSFGWQNMNGCKGYLIT